MRRCVVAAAVCALLMTACQQTPDHMVTAGPIDRESPAHATPAAETARYTQSEDDLQLCSNIDFSQAVRKPRPADPYALLKGPVSARRGTHEITVTYVPRDATRANSLRLVHADGLARPAAHTVPLVTSAFGWPWLLRPAHILSIAANAERWLLAMRVHARVQWSQFLPGEFDPDAVRATVRPRVQGAEGVRGLAFAGTYDESDDETAESVRFECFASWAQMGVTPEELALAGISLDYETGDIPPGLTYVSTYILTARWGEEPIRTGPSPYVRGNCCDIQAFDTGFVAFSPGVFPWASRSYECEVSASTCSPTLHLSSDGLAWEPVEVPTRYFGSNPYSGHNDFEIPIWVCSVATTADGLLVREAVDLDNWEIYRHYEEGYDVLSLCGEGTYWLVDEDLTNWRKLLAAPAGFGEKADD
ncbi:MAG: hypothetical protein F4Y66_13270 [Acidimicrobiales bacterium]|nr:hypothetical protein [Acidimicrobiales bacterium]